MLTYGSFHFDGIGSQEEYILLSQEYIQFIFIFLDTVRLLPEEAIAIHSPTSNEKFPIPALAIGSRALFDFCKSEE